MKVFLKYLFIALSLFLSVQINAGTYSAKKIENLAKETAEIANAKNIAIPESTANNIEDLGGVSVVNKLGNTGGRFFKSVDEFISKTALPVIDNFGSILKPDKMVIVKVPAGAKIRKSVARSQDWGGQGHLPGGAIQYEIVDFDWQNMENWFKDIGSINEFIK